MKLTSKLLKKALVVYHGSPHTFDEFSTEYMGKGEGAQAFGWGIYFTANPNIAKNYQDGLSGQKSRGFNTLDGKKITKKLLAQLMKDPNHLISLFFNGRGATASGTTDVRKALQETINENSGYEQEFRQRAQSYRDNPPYKSTYSAEDLDARADSYKKMVDTYKDLMSRLGYQEEKVNQGAFYEAQIPDGPYLLWDEPLAGQPEVMAYMDKTFMRPRPPYQEHYTVISRDLNPQTHTGRDLLNAMGHDRHASQELLKAGIRGVKYKDGLTRGHDDKASYNYVVFSDKDIKVLKRAGLRAKMLKKASRPIPQVLYHGRSADRPYRGNYIFLTPSREYALGYSRGPGTLMAFQVQVPPDKIFSMQDPSRVKQALDPQAWGSLMRAIQPGEELDWASIGVLADDENEEPEDFMQALGYRGMWLKEREGVDSIYLFNQGDAKQVPLPE